MTDIWHSVTGNKFIQVIEGYGFRLVESQETVATMEIVSSLEKQSILENMLDLESKPEYRPGTEHLHYLLSSPFRYPPLKHGSRFGRQFEPSLFYGGASESVTLCESAYYKFYFYHDMEDAPDCNYIQSQHTLFKFRYKTEDGIKLQDSPFDVYEVKLRDPADYRMTQKLGFAMRNDDVKGFEYRSARDRQGNINIALFDTLSLASRKPINERSCLCQVNGDEVIFSIQRKIIKFYIKQFLVNGSLPIPAA